MVKVLEDGKRELTEGFSRFMLHYRFRAEFCNPAAGNKKGNVENKEGSWHNAFVSVPTETFFEAFNEWLWEWCEKDARRLHYKYKIPFRSCGRRIGTRCCSCRSIHSRCFAMRPCQ